MMAVIIHLNRVSFFAAREESAFGWGIAALCH
jgi:hypothetical protein